MQRGVLKNASPVLVAATLGGIVWVSAGDLNPPRGLVTPTMKTLAEVEPRIAINNTNTPGDGTSTFKITEPGSYYLTGNVNAVPNTNGLAIDAADVTVDLAGYAVIGGVNSTLGSGIVLGNVSNVEIRNGTVRDFAVFGIHEGFTTGNAHRIIGVRVVSNSSDGIDLVGDGNQVENCMAEDNGTHGISCGNACSVIGSTVLNNGIGGVLAGPGSTVTGNTVRNNGGNSGDPGIFAGPGSTVTGNTSCNNNPESGIFANFGSTVTGNTVCNNGRFGIQVGHGSTVTGNTATGNTADGIWVSSDCRVEHNLCQGNGLDAGSGAGIRTSGSNNRIVGNHLTGADRGLHIDGGGNHIADNTVKGNADNYDIAAGNHVNLLLGEIPESIDWPAVVTLEGSLTGVIGQNGITINADDVTIDLGGHSLVGIPGSLHGIFMDSRSNVEIRNGTVRGFGGSGIGVSTFPGGGQGHRVIGVRVVSNLLGGINRLGIGSLIKDCTAERNGDDGIATAGGSTVAGNTAIQNLGLGILVASGCTVTGNTAILNGESGIGFSGGDTLVDQNVVFQNDQNGTGTGNMEACPTCTFGLNHAP